MMIIRALKRLGMVVLLVVTVYGGLFVSSGPAEAPGSSQPGPAPGLDEVRAALEKYQDPIKAVHDGYFSTLGCVEYPSAGAAGHVPNPAGGMGIHFLNTNLIGPVPDPLHPQILLYEQRGEKLRLTAAEWFIPLETGVKERPSLFGHPFDGPMEGHHPIMPSTLHHYDLHVWLWKKNPAGIFSATNPDVKCNRKAPYSLMEEAPKLVPAP
jgi:hypothetical protein